MVSRAGDPVTITALAACRGQWSSAPMSVKVPDLLEGRASPSPSVSFKFGIDSHPTPREPCFRGSTWSITIDGEIGKEGAGRELPFEDIDRACALFHFRSS